MPLLPTARPPTVSRLLHALSRLDGFTPGPEFLGEAESACAATAARWDQSSLALVFQAWSWLRYQPGKATVAALLERAREMMLEVPGGGPGEKGGSFSSQNLGTLIASLGELKRCPDDRWMAAFQQAVAALLPRAAPKDISFFLKGLAKLNYYPGPRMMDVLLLALTPHVGSLQGIDLQVTITSLVGLHHRPPPAFAAAFQQRALQLLVVAPSDAGARGSSGSSSGSSGGIGIAPRDLAIIIWSFAALEIPGARAFLRLLAAAAAAQLRSEQPRWALPDGHPDALSVQERWALTARVRQLRQVYLYSQCQEAKDKEAAAAGPGGELAGLAGDWEALGLPALVDAGLAAGSEELVLARAQESAFHKEVRACVVSTLGGLVGWVDWGSLPRALPWFLWITQVAEVLQSLGASTLRAVDCFVLDVLIEPPAPLAAQQQRLEQLEQQPAAAAAAEAPPARPTAKGKRGKKKAASAAAAAAPAASAAAAGATAPLPILLLLHGPSRFLRGRLGAPKLEAGTAMKARVLTQLSGRRFTRVACVDVWEWAAGRTREARIELLKSKVGARLLESYLTPPSLAEPSPSPRRGVGNCTLAAA